jgi:hypothetical protein
MDGAVYEHERQVQSRCKSSIPCCLIPMKHSDHNSSKNFAKFIIRSDYVVIGEWPSDDYVNRN